MELMVAMMKYVKHVGFHCCTGQDGDVHARGSHQPRWTRPEYGERRTWRWGFWQPGDMPTVFAEVYTCILQTMHMHVQINL
jgi:hypothetical protein